MVATATAAATAANPNVAASDTCWQITLCRRHAWLMQACARLGVWVVAAVPLSFALRLGFQLPPSSLKLLCRGFHAICLLLLTLSLRCLSALSFLACLLRLG